MKKILIPLVIIAVLLIVCTYIFIPGTIKVSKSLTINAPKDALYRKLVNAGNWGEWWPEKQKLHDTINGYVMNGIRFYPGEPKTLSLPVLFKAGDLSGTSEITFIAEEIETTNLHYEVSISASVNPFKRITAYNKAKKLANQFSSMLTAINNTYSDTKNLYDYDIQKKLVVDSTLIFTSVKIKGFPDNNSIYLLIDKLKNYINSNDAKETGSPMLNILTKDSITYLVKVAIPVDKKLPSFGDISYRWMLGGGNILITEVKGDQTEINNAHKQILNYIADYRRVAPAIPFESLITDRRKEQDSNKWVTRIYYPVK